ncbi:MAG: HAMP domain-containing sensor histidine kinase, partial [Pseudomonadota bacterium]
QSLLTALYHLDRARTILERNLGRFETLCPPPQVTLFREDLSNYGRLMSSCDDESTRPAHGSHSDVRPECESKTRKIGASLATFAEGVIRQKRQSIKETLHTTVQLQLLAFGIVAGGLMATGGFLITKVLKPLRRLEENTERIAKGCFEPIDDLPPEREVRDIFESFNRMAHELKIREEQLVQSKKLASLGTMMAGVAHEVNNPLSNISSSCEILLEELEDDDKDRQRDLLKKVLEQVDKAGGIVRDLLEFSRSKEFLKESFNVKDILERTLRLCRGQIPASIQVVTKIDEKLALFADKHRMQQAFMNLITNAVQAVGADGEIRIGAYGDRDGMVTILIRDTGHGISEKALPHIFDPFYTTKDVGQGTGLGLFITHDIIVRHGGTIRAGSNPGKGTTFIIKMPAQE